ncbi:efflux RND transporter periplasmic adaptor subunit [Neptunomonas phycophila]|uniref:efflux RND transporter periplasmic adaptor subunit n=1 Tax=Neptunomonas phycophila TaxID=1572645 RepID=UPI0015C05F96|nr:efflux RND transporter periplasmic adaptor subunit [Neptunomonas phycophila]
MHKFLLFSALTLLVSACTDQTVMVEDPVRAVKTLTVTESTKANSRQLAGTVVSANESELSFRVGGRVASVDVSTGDKISKGQLLATLEKKEYELAVQTAKAKLSSARAELTEKSDALKRQQNLKAKEFVAQASVDQAQAAFTAAKSNVDVAITDLENAQRDLANTVLIAPFDGSVVMRSIEPFVEVAAGSTVFEIQSQGVLKVEVLMPETLIRDISYGDTTSVRFPTLKDVVVYGSISGVGSKAERGNAFPVKVELAQTSEDIRPGMTAQVTFNYGEAAEASIYLIPITALDVRIPVDNEASLDNEVPVFVLEDGVAQRRKLTLRDIRGNKLEVIDGLKPGDVVITAGVPFINDGQKVKAWEPTYNLPAVIQK